MSGKTKITVERMFQENREVLKMVNVLPAIGLNRRLNTTEPHRVGLALAGYFDYFAYDRPQIFGKTEMTFLSSLTPKERYERLKRFFGYRLPCVIIAKNIKIPKELLDLAKQVHVPVFRSVLATSTVVSRIAIWLEEALAPETDIHATFVDVHGIGVLIMGESGVGKSECALELIERGHRLVADDVVHVHLRQGGALTGTGSELIRHHMEIRGLGIINIEKLFGVRAIRHLKRIGMVVTLEKWNDRKEYERLGLEERHFKILDVDLPHFIIPVRPGRNISLLIEVGALNERLKRMGVNAAGELNQNLLAAMRSAKKATRGTHVRQRLSRKSL